MEFERNTKFCHMNNFYRSLINAPSFTELLFTLVHNGDKILLFVLVVPIEVQNNCLETLQK